jgi:hypothetical protein
MATDRIGLRRGMRSTLPRRLAGFQRTSTISQSRQNLDGRTIIAMALLIVLGFLALLGVAVLAGRTADTRDPEYSLGRVLAPRAASDAQGR